MTELAKKLALLKAPNGDQWLVDFASPSHIGWLCTRLAGELTSDELKVLVEFKDGEAS